MIRLLSHAVTHTKTVTLNDKVNISCLCDWLMFNAQFVLV